MELITTIVFRVPVYCLQLNLMTPCVSLLSCFIMVPFDRYDACIISENLCTQCIAWCYLHLGWYLFVPLQYNAPQHSQTKCIF